MPSFLHQQVDPNRPDGYWVETFPYSTTAQEPKPPHLIGYGLGTSEADSKVLLYLNPYNSSVSPYTSATRNAPWEKREIAQLRFPVACTIAEISSNGFNDVILSDEYGPSMNDIWPNGGRVSWFENTGDIDNVHWKRRFIGKSPGMHRLKAGHFTRQDRVQIVAVPIVIRSSDLTSPAPVIIYTAPDDPSCLPPDDDSVGWPADIPFPDTFRLVHEIFVVKKEGHLDQIVLAGREGLSIIWFDTNAQTWLSEHLGVGCPEISPNPYWGSGSVAVARVGDDHAGYIGSCEGFHGNTVSAYVKPTSSPPGTLVGVNWTRVVLEDFGPLNSEFTGSIHQVVCADIDGDGVDEILVALMGSDPPTWEPTGVWCYKPIDLEKGTFKKTKLSDDSAGRIAIGDFTDRGLVDFATISYSVPGYFESPGPAVNCYASSPITAQKLNDEVLFLLPNPTEAKLIDEVEFLDVSSRKLSLVVLPPKARFSVGINGGVKVILGELRWTGPNGSESRTPATTPFGTASNIVASEDNAVQAGPDGAAFMLLKPSATSGAPPYNDMSQLVAYNIFPPRFPAEIRKMQFPWVKVEDRPWANGRFKGLEFYNLVGFQVKLNNDALQHVCHIQMWTAGIGVSAGFHNHTGDLFCEIHSCIVNGTGQGGMSWATVADDKFDPNNPDPAKYDSIVVADMHEHGPLWRTKEDGLPAFRKNSSVDYPWHAWLAGFANGPQSFDVWIAFEFPPLTAAAVRSNTIVPPSSAYVLRHASLNSAATVKDGDSTDGTPIIGADFSLGLREQQWDISLITGTRTLNIKNRGSGSFATTNWPPVSGQLLVGSRSPAVLGITSNWIFTLHDRENIKIYLVGTNLVWTLNLNNQIVLEEERTGNEKQNWKLEPLYEPVA